LREWTTFTPDGRRLVVYRREEDWFVICGQRGRAHHHLLDVALIEAIRGDEEFAAHLMPADFGAWVRELADQVEDWDGDADSISD
jgi:hypothetical protein